MRKEMAIKGWVKDEGQSMEGWVMKRPLSPVLLHRIINKNLGGFDV